MKYKHETDYKNKILSIQYSPMRTNVRLQEYKIALQLNNNWVHNLKINFFKSKNSKII